METALIILICIGGTSLIGAFIKCYYYCTIQEKQESMLSLNLKSRFNRRNKVADNIDININTGIKTFMVDEEIKDERSHQLETRHSEMV
jgi:hypothetical protein